MKPLSFALLVILGMSFAACSEGVRPSADRGAPIHVAVAEAAMHDIAEPFEAGGVIRARSVAQVVSRIMATVESVRVTPGDRVRAGQPLVILDSRDLRASHEQAQAALAAAQESAGLAEADVEATESALNLARLTHRRISDLRAARSATQQELDEAENQLNAAEARLKVARARVAESAAGIRAASAAAGAASVASSYASLVAPFEGLVTEKLVDPGNMATPGMPLVTVEDTRGFRLDARLDESRAVLVAPGDDVGVELDASLAAPATAGAPDPAVLAGRVAEVARMLDPGAHDFVVKIDLPQLPGLRSGMFARAVFTGPSHRVLAVPAGAIVRRGQLSFVYVVEDGRSLLRLVNVAQSVGGLVEVRSGLVAGEAVIVDPPADLADGDAVTPAPSKGTGR